MKALRLVLVMVALLSVLIVAGCQEGYTSRNNQPEYFAWEQSATGFWQPRLSYTYTSDSAYEISRK